MTVSRCSRCHRILKDPFSIKLGMGPECRSLLTKRGWRFPKPVYAVKDGHVQFIGMRGKVAPPGPNTRLKQAGLNENGYIRKDFAGMLNWAVIVLFVLFILCRDWPW